MLRVACLGVSAIVLCVLAGGCTGSRTVSGPRAVGPGGPSWLTNYEQALAQSRQTGKPVMALFSGSDWCGWCIKLHEEVLVTPRFAQWAGDHVVLLEVDFPRNTDQTADIMAQNRQLKSKYGVRGYPTILFLRADGSVMCESGYVSDGPDAWIAQAEGALAKAGRQ